MPSNQGGACGAGGRSQRQPPALRGPGRHTRSATPALDTSAAHQGFGAYEEEGGRAAALIKRRRSWTEAAPMRRPAILPSGEITSVLGKALRGTSRSNSAAIR